MPIPVSNNEKRFSSAGKRILLFDHRSTRVKPLYEALQAQGCIVRLVFNGPEALAHARTWRADLIAVLATESLPGLPHLCQRIRLCTEAPIVILSADLRKEVMIESLDAGACDYIPVRTSMTEITARIRAQLRRSPQLQAIAAGAA